MFNISTVWGHSPKRLHTTVPSTARHTTKSVSAASTTGLVYASRLIASRLANWLKGSAQATNPNPPTLGVIARLIGR